MAVPASTVFVLGATGYIGGSLLVALKRRHPEFKYSALVRNPKDFAAIEALGVRVVHGSNQGLDIIEKEAAAHDIVFNTGDSDDIVLAQAIIKGKANRASVHKSGPRPILIHTSGTGVVIDAPTGAYNPETASKVYDDNVVADLEGIDINAFHRKIDLEIIGAGEKGDIDAYIIAPSTIYGKGTGPVRNTSIQVNAIIRAGIKFKEVVQIGPGTNVSNSVHINDLVDLYLLVLDLALSGTNRNKGFANYYFGSYTEFAWGDVAKELARLMYQKGLVATETVRSIAVSDPEVQQVPTLAYTAHNARTVANRGFALGWKPSGKPLMEALAEEIDLTASQL